MSDGFGEAWKAIKAPPAGIDFDGYFRIQDKDGQHIATVAASTVYGKPVGNGLEYAERIVACVNACKGIPTHTLESAENAFCINDQERGLFVQINCGPALPTRPTVKIEIAE